MIKRLKKLKSDKLKQILKKINYFDYFLEINKSESDYINENLEEIEEEVLRQIYKNRKIIPALRVSTYNENELNEYINKIFEQQEKERIVRWLVNSIRESLDLNQVLEKIVEEIGKLLKVDRCLVSLYDKTTGEFHLHNEYIINETVPGVLNNSESLILHLPQNWRKTLFKDNKPLVINDSEDEILDEEEKRYLSKNNTKSIIAIPVIDKNEILGTISVHQVLYKRTWKNNHIEILKDTGSQISIAIRQAILYTKVQETTKLKSEFLTSMSHEFRTPLNAIIGFSEMLISEDYGKLNDKQKKFMKNVALSGQHLLKLVNDILDLSKIESGNLEINYEVFNVNFAIFETVSVLKGMAEKKNISIKTKFEGNIVINADMMRFNQIMYNLLSNAIKFTEENGQIFINSAFIDGNVKIEVRDTGIGISKENRDKVFQEFTQINSSYTKKQQGSGLGLPLTKKLVEMHKGYIDFESQEEKGSKFWFILPEATLRESANLQTL